MSGIPSPQEMIIAARNKAIEEINSWLMTNMRHLCTSSCYREYSSAFEDTFPFDQMVFDRLLFESTGWKCESKKSGWKCDSKKSALIYSEFFIYSLIISAPRTSSSQDLVPISIDEDTPKVLSPLQIWHTWKEYIESNVIASMNDIDNQHKLCVLGKNITFTCGFLEQVSITIDFLESNGWKVFVDECLVIVLSPLHNYLI